MFRMLEFREGKVTAIDAVERVVPPPEGSVCWFDLEAQDVTQLETLRKSFDFHPLAIEDCAHFDQRPKREEYRDHTFLVTQGFASQAAGERRTELSLHELHSFLAERYLVTVHLESIAPLEKVWQRAASSPALFERGIDFLYYLVVDGMVDANFPIIESISDELEELEEKVLVAPRRRDMQRIFEVKRQLVSMRKVLSPQRDVIGLLAKRGDPQVSERTSLYMRDVYDHLLRINESIDANRDLLGNVVDAYLSAVGQRSNEIMKALTILSAVFLPLAFVVGFFGQNFDSLPGHENWVHSDRLMWVMIAICVSTPVAMFVWFWRKRWL
jgi:magnesium transporter